MSSPNCKRCLLNELDGEYFKSIYQYIENIPLEQKAPPRDCLLYTSDAADER